MFGFDFFFGIAVGVVLTFVVAAWWDYLYPLDDDK